MLLKVENFISIFCTLKVQANSSFSGNCKWHHKKSLNWLILSQGIKYANQISTFDSIFYTLFYFITSFYAGCVCGPRLEKNKTSNSHHVPSWIWQMSHQCSSSSNDQDLYMSLWVKWCKAQQQAAWYKEEVGLVVEEMWQKLTFFNWLTCQWEGKATAPSMSGSKMDGITTTSISTYTHKQATMYHKVINIFVDDWYQYLKTNSLGSSWLSHYHGPPATKWHCLPSNMHLAVLHLHSPVNTILPIAISAQRLKNGRLKLKTRPLLLMSINLKDSWMLSFFYYPVILQVL